MKRSIVSIRSAAAVVCCLCTAMSHAVIIVDGTGGGGKYATLEEASDVFRESVSEDTIEIQTDGPIAGLDLRDRILPRPLTIQAGDGYRPVITGAMLMIPNNESDTTVTLTGLTVDLPTSDIPTGIPLFVACNVVAEDCIFRNTAVSPWAPGVACGYPNNSTDSYLSLTSCTVQAHTAIMVGRSVRDYDIKDCTIIATSDIPGFSTGISHYMNFPPNFGTIPYSEQGYPATPDERTVTMENTIVNSTGRGIAWPPYHIASAENFALETNTVGPINATNCVFASIGNATGGANTFGDVSLPRSNNNLITMKHCTFRKNYQFGMLYINPGTTVTLENCLFDDPFPTGYTIGTEGGEWSVAGRNNAYNVLDSTRVGVGGVPFESEGTAFIRISADGNDYASDLSGNVLESAESLVAGLAAELDPPVETDKDKESRPQPVSAMANDIGADEFAETQSVVRDWQLF